MDAGTCLDDDDDARLFVAVSVSCSCSVSSSSSSSVGSRRGWGNLLFVIDETGSQGKEVKETGDSKVDASGTRTSDRPSDHTNRSNSLFVVHG